MRVQPEEIFAAFLPQIEKYKAVPNRRCVICFAGTPGSGKTWLAVRLEADLRGVRISNDEIRKLIIARGITDLNSRESLKERVLELVIAEIKTWNNGLIIMDSGIERRFQPIRAAFSDYKIVVIALDASKSFLAHRIRTRKGHWVDIERTVGLLDRWLADKQQFMEENGNFVQFKLDVKAGFDYESVKKAIISEVKA